VRPPCKREREVQVLSRAPITESEAGGVLHAVANRWVPLAAWPSSGPLSANSEARMWRA